MSSSGGSASRRLAEVTERSVAPISRGMGFTPRVLEHGACHRRPPGGSAGCPRAAVQVEQAPGRDLVRSRRRPSHRGRGRRAAEGRVLLAGSVQHSGRVYIAKVTPAGALVPLVRLGRSRDGRRTARAIRSCPAGRPHPAGRPPFPDGLRLGTAVGRAAPSAGGGPVEPGWERRPQLRRRRTARTGTRRLPARPGGDAGRRRDVDRYRAERNEGTPVVGDGSRLHMGARPPERRRGPRSDLRRPRVAVVPVKTASGCPSKPARMGR